MDELVACKDCIAVIPPPEDGGRSDAFCKRTPLKTFNPYEGTYTEDGFQLCVFVNIDGHCPIYEPKEVNNEQ